MPVATRAQTAALSSPRGQCPSNELQSEMQERDYQMLVTIADTIHDFGDEEDVHKKVIESLREEIDCLVVAMPVEKQETLWKLDTNGKVLQFRYVKPETSVMEVLDKKYNIFPYINFQETSIFKPWNQRNEIQPSTTINNYKYQSEILYLGKPSVTNTNNTDVFMNPKELEEYLKQILHADKIRYVVDNGTLLSTTSFFCKKTGDNKIDWRKTYYPIATIYDRGYSKKTLQKNCIKNEFLEYSITQKDKELIQLEYVKVVEESRTRKKYKLVWKDSTKDSLEKIVNLELKGNGNKFLEMLKEVAEKCRDVSASNRAKVQEIYNILTTESINKIQQVYGLTLDKTKLWEEERRRYIRCLYDFKRMGDFLQVRSAQIANQKMTEEGKNTRYVFFSNDRLSAIEATLQGVPSVLTMRRGNKQELQKFIYLFIPRDIAPVTATQAPVTATTAATAAPPEEPTRRASQRSQRDQAQEAEAVATSNRALASQQRLVSQSAPPASRRTQQPIVVVPRISRDTVDKEVKNLMSLGRKDQFLRASRQLQQNQPELHQRLVTMFEDSNELQSVASGQETVSNRRFTNRKGWWEQHLRESMPAARGGAGSSPREGLMDEPVDIGELLAAMSPAQRRGPFGQLMEALGSIGYELTFFYYVVFRFYCDVLAGGEVLDDDEEDDAPRKSRSKSRRAAEPDLRPYQPPTVARAQLSRPLTAARQALPGPSASATPSRSLARPTTARMTRPGPSALPTVAPTPTRMLLGGEALPGPSASAPPSPSLARPTTAWMTRRD